MCIKESSLTAFYTCFFIFFYEVIRKLRLPENLGKKKPNLGESWADKNKNMWRISQIIM